MTFKSFLQTIYTIIHWIDTKMTFLFRAILGFLAAHPDWVWRLIFFVLVILMFLKLDKKLKAKSGGNKTTVGATLLRILVWLIAIQLVVILFLSVYLASK